MKEWIVIAAALCAAILSGCAGGGNPAAPGPIVLNSHDPFCNVVSSAEYLEDPSGNLNLGDILGEARDRFRPAGVDALNCGYTRSVYWLRFSVRNTARTSRWYLHCDYPLIDDIRFYIPGPDGNYDEKAAGRRYPFIMKDVAVRNFVLFMDIEPGGEKTCYLKFASKDSLVIPLKIWRPSAFNRRQYSENMLFGIYYGIIMVMIILYVLMFFTTRDRNHLIYAATLLTFHFLFELGINGFSFKYAPFLPHWWARDSIALFCSLGLAASALFCKSFCNLREEMPRANMVLNIMIAWGLFEAMLAFTVDYFYAIQSAVVMCMCTGGLVWIFTIISMARGNRPARYYLLAWSTIVGGGLIYGFKVWGIFPSNFITEYTWQFGFAIDPVLLLFALGARISELRTEKERAQGEALRLQKETSEALEKKVRERTEDLLKSEEKYRTILEGIAEGYYELDRGGDFTFFNRSLCDIVGYPAHELLKMNYRDCMSAETARFLFETYSRVYREDAGASLVEYPLIRKDGTVRYLETTVSLLKDGRGGKIGFRGMVRDITDRKKAEEARRELEEQKSRFFSNVSHEIRTPLTLMLSPLEAWLQGDYPGQADRAFFENLYRNGLRLLKLINNLLDFSKLEAGRMSALVRAIDIVQFLRNYLSTIQSTADLRRISLVFDAAPERVNDLYFDPEKMDKVFMNLLSNALKFTEPGGSITLRVRDGDDRCTVECEDTGCGIPADRLDAVFERFGQADTARQRRSEGTGIGLALAKEFVLMHGGAITVSSRCIEDHADGHGSVFSVTLLKGTDHLANLPGVVIEEEGRSVPSMRHRFFGMREMADIAESAEGRAEAGAALRRHGEEPRRTVLVVDDNADMRSFLVTILGGEFRIIAAADGHRGLAMAETERPDLVIADVMMPGISGHEMTRRIKEGDATRNVPVIMLTARAEMPDKIEGLRAGADDYLTKPFNPKELLVRVRALVRKHEYERAIEERNRQIEEELDVARLLQRRLLPAGDLAFPGCRTGSLYIPMEAVGGDFYDYRVRDGVIELFIADVSGHGLTGAFLATITKVAFDCDRSAAGPGGTLRLLNEVVCRSSVKGNFVTCFLCGIDLVRGTIRYCNAGHVPPILCRVGGECAELAARGKPLGWRPDADFEERETSLAPGDRLVLFTDGVTECMDPGGGLFGDDRLSAIIRESSRLSPNEFLARLHDRLKAHASSGAFVDDISLLVFDVTGGAAAGEPRA